MKTSVVTVFAIPVPPGIRVLVFQRPIEIEVQQNESAYKVEKLGFYSGWQKQIDDALKVWARMVWETTRSLNQAFTHQLDSVEREAKQELFGLVDLVRSGISRAGLAEAGATTEERKGWAILEEQKAHLLRVKSQMDALLALNITLANHVRWAVSELEVTVDGSPYLLRLQSIAHSVGPFVLSQTLREFAKKWVPIYLEDVNLMGAQGDERGRRLHDFEKRHGGRPSIYAEHSIWADIEGLGKDWKSNYEAVAAMVWILRWR